ncbi:MAG TPA: hypothetical protein VFM33_11840 [Aquabacterium sp.]|nr:hypothetical protein [Aquabacterium sp.]
MLHTPKRSRKLKAPPPTLAEPAIVERPDGYYWRSDDGRQDFGPFETYEQALADRDAASEEALAPTAALHESEEAIGMANWIDPETGAPAEGESPPRLAEE